MSETSKFIVLLLSVLLFAACGNSPPKINQIYDQINYKLHPDTGSIHSEMSLFLNADDENGVENIEFLHMVNEKDQILWYAESSSFIYRSRRGMRLFGFEHAVMSDGSVFPPGEYEVIITDKAGSKDSGNIFIPVIKKMPEAELFPAVDFVNEKTINVESPSRHNIISFFDNEGNSLGAFTVTPGELDLGRLNNSSVIIDGWRSLEVAYYSESEGAGLISGPFIR